MRIEDYALIGDCQTAALVGKNGSIDWLCLPRFDSAACFAALLGTSEKGRWLIAPDGDAKAVRRKYRDGTLILETEFDTGEASVRLIDFMPIRSGNADVVRIVEGVRGTTPMRMELVIRFDYGAIVPWVRRRNGILRAIAGPDLLRLRSPVTLRGRDFRTVSEFTVSEGQRIAFDLTWQPSHFEPSRFIDPELALVDTEDFWKSWSGRCVSEGPWSAAVQRSLITLKALTYAPTGGMVAAPTTSLPEFPGGVRNWDYRYCWLRDATFTLYALLQSGYRDEARAWREWLLRAVAGKPSQIQIMYGIAGERRLTEYEIPWLSGYQESRPVRVGNGAYRQHQLDVFGEVMDTLYHCWREGIAPGDEGWRLEKSLMQHLETGWKEPDEGIWEVRGPRRHFTHSKVMAWVAFDRAVKAVEQFGLSGPASHWRSIRDAIHEEICRNGFNSSRGSFVQSYGSRHLDASLLTLPLVGFLPATDPRIRRTVQAIEEELVEDGFVARYITDPEVDGLPPGEGAFLLCSFWYADALELMGRHEEARRVFQAVIDIRNDVGLLSESYNIGEHRLVGNFPQAFSHIGLINTARNLTRHGGPAEDRPLH